jgi:hypothetical protein
MILQSHSHVMWYNIVMKLSSRSRDTRYSLYGGPTGLRKAGTVSFFNAMWMLSAAILLLNEYELIRIIDDIFKKLRISTVIKINNRKVLAGIAEYIGESDRIIDITVAIDKLDKIGLRMLIQN